MAENSKNAVKPVAVPNRQLWDGETIPVIGQGTYKFDGTADDLAYGMNLGATLIDTAEIYGTDEVAASAALGFDGYYWVSHKFWRTHNSRDDVIRFVDDFVTRTGCGISILFLHFPSDSGVPLQKTMGGIDYVIESGMALYAGVSNLSLSDLELARGYMRHNPITFLQYRYNMNRREIEADILPYSQDNDMMLMAYEPLDQGRLATQAGEALRWVLRHENTIVIPRSSNREHIKANIEAVCNVA